MKTEGIRKKRIHPVVDICQSHGLKSCHKLLLLRLYVAGILSFPARILRKRTGSTVQQGYVSMTQPKLFQRLMTTLSICFAVSVMNSAMAQVIRGPLGEGFDRSSSVDVSVDEMLGMKKPRAANEDIVGPGFPSLWITEIQYKSVRLMRLPVVDPATGKTTDELVWYMVWRLIPRDYTELAGAGRPDLLKKLSDPDQDPLNDTDALRANSIQIPRLSFSSKTKA